MPISNQQHDRPIRHILSLSGGKDSTALAMYMRDRVPELEYVFCDTEKELPETYDYLARLEAYLGRQIVRLKHDGRGFDHHLAVRHGFLPSPHNRWCTEYLKLKPFEAYVRDDQVRNYIGIRADEDRKGYISHKQNITPVYPFREAGITKADVLALLESSGLGLPAYYSWRSRSGCYFCFFQQKIEWVGLLENHPDLFAEAQRYERSAPGEESYYTWTQNESLEDLSHPDRVALVKSEHARHMSIDVERFRDRPLVEIFDDLMRDTMESPCLICEL